MGIGMYLLHSGISSCLYYWQSDVALLIQATTVGLWHVQAEVLGIWSPSFWLFALSDHACFHTMHFLVIIAAALFVVVLVGNGHVH